VPHFEDRPGRAGAQDFWYFRPGVEEDHKERGGKERGSGYDECTDECAGAGAGPDPVLASYRQSIDNIDAALVFMLAERFKVTQAVGRYKAESGLPPADPGREDQQIARLRALAAEAELDPEFSEKFLRFIIDEVIRHPQQLRG
jgi:chorismate mutase